MSSSSSSSITTTTMATPATAKNTLASFEGNVVDMFASTHFRRLLNTLSTMPSPTPNAKTTTLIPVSYARTTHVAILSPKQRAILYAVWNSFTPEQQEEVFNKDLDLPTGNGITREANTTKHDQVRIMHIVCDTRYQDLMREAYTPMENRAILDDRLNRRDPFQDLVDVFNNRDIHYTNVAVTVGLHGTRTCSQPEFTTVFDFIKDLNPDDPTRAVRSSTWFKKTFDALKGPYSQLLANFHKSGNQNNQDPHGEFMAFVRDKHEHFSYMFIMFKEGETDHWITKEMPMVRNQTQSGTSSTPAPTTTLAQKRKIDAANNNNKSNNNSDSEQKTELMAKRIALMEQQQQNDLRAIEQNESAMRLSQLTKSIEARCNILKTLSTVLSTLTGAAQDVTNAMMTDTLRKLAEDQEELNKINSSI